MSREGGWGWEEFDQGCVMWHDVFVSSVFILLSVCGQNVPRVTLYDILKTRDIKCIQSVNKLI